MSNLLPNGLMFDPDCNTTSRYTQALDFINQGDKICICGNTRVCDDGLCAKCYLIIEESKAYREGEELN